MEGLHPGTGRSRRSNEIFISYRRGDADGQAHALRDRLTREYGRGSVFMDVESIVPGADFAEVITNELASTDVLLVLIGTNWQKDREGRDRLSDPGDFVRLEVAAALQRNIPTIPVLIETASLPEWRELPEALRPLVRMQAVSLRSASWDYDISRVVSAVAKYIKSLRRSRRIWPMIAGAAVVFAVMAALVWLPRLARPLVSHPLRPAAPLTAATAVAAVQPDRLIENLLNTPFAGYEVPSGYAVKASALSDELTSLTNANGGNNSEAPGLMATVSVRFSGGGNINIFYLTFDDDYDAGSYFSSTSPAPPDYKYAGPFSHSAIGDSTKCQRTTGQGEVTSWGCLTLSANVITYSSVIQSNSSDGPSTESALAHDAVYHLKAAAITQPRTEMPIPPGDRLNPVGLFTQLQSSFPANLIPIGLSHPQVTSPPLPSPPPGLEEDHYIDIIFSGSAAHYNTSYININVFDNARDARSHYDKPIFLNSSGLRITQTYDVLSAPSGFSATQQARCYTYAVSSESGDVSQGLSACFVQWGDVVVSAGTKLNATQADPNPESADNSMAITLALSGLLFVGQTLSA